MAAPVDAGRFATTADTSAGTSHVVNVGSPAAGVMLVMLIRFGASPGTITASGWTQRFNTTTDASDDTTAVYWRWSDGTEGATKTVTTTSSVKAAAVVWHVTGAINEAFAFTTIQIFGTTANAADCPGIAPSPAPADTLYLAMMGCDGPNSANITAAPTNYSNLVVGHTGSGGAAATNCMVAGASRQLLASSLDDPGAFTHAARTTASTAFGVAIRGVILLDLADTMPLADAFPFPSAPVLDSFTRANEGPPVTGGYPIQGGFAVASNELAPTLTGDNYLLDEQVGADPEVYIDIVTPGVVGSNSALSARHNGSTTYYSLGHLVQAITDLITLTKVIAGSPTSLGAWAVELPAGSALGLRCTGSQIEAWARVSGVWTLLGTATDTSITGAATGQYLGFLHQGGGSTTARFDNFGGGAASGMVQEFNVSLPDTVALADSLLLETGLALDLTDTVALADSLAADFVLPLDLADSVSLAESFPLPARFPTTPVFDTFNRADEGPPPTGWTAWGTNALKIVSNQLAPNDADFNYQYWNTAFPPDVEAYVTLAAMPATSGGTTIAARLNPAGGGGFGDFYAVAQQVEAGTDYVYIQRIDNSATTYLTGAIAVNFAPGDKLGIRCIGSQIEAWVCLSGTWSRIASVTDTTYPGTGSDNKIGLGMNGNGTTVARYDDFGGGGVLVFPSTPALDNFNRADENPLAGANWIGYGNPVKVVSNQVAPITDQGGAGWTAALGRDQEVYIDIAVPGASTYIYARYDRASHGYICTHGGGNIQLIRADEGWVQTPLGPAWPVTLVAGDAYGLRCIGSVIEAWVRRSGNWALVGSAVDSTYPGTAPSDKIAFWHGNGGNLAVRFDNFGGGTVAFSPALEEGLGLNLADAVSLVDSVPFPSSPILDNFNRANEGPPPSGWTTLVDGFTVDANRIAPFTSTGASMYWSTAMAGPDVEAYVDVEALTFPVATATRLYARDDNAGNSYCITLYQEGGGNNWVRLERMVAYAATTIAGVWYVNVAAGDAIGIRCIGSEIQAWVRKAGTWSLVGAVTDTAIPGTGSNNKLTLYHHGGGSSTAARFDNFGGGVVSPVPYPVLGINVPLTDSAALVDLLDAPLVIITDLADTVGLIDAFAAQDDNELAPTDTLALSDSLTWTATYDFTLPDTVALADAFTHAVELGLVPSDTVALADLFDSVFGRNLDLADPLGLIDLFDPGMSYDTPLSDTVSLSDSLSIATTVVLVVGSPKLTLKGKAFTVPVPVVASLGNPDLILKGKSFALAISSIVTTGKPKLILRGKRASAGQPGLYPSAPASVNLIPSAPEDVVLLATAPPFPTTPLLDDFNRANASPMTGWTEAAEFTGFKTLANQAVPITPDGVANVGYYNTPFGPDQEGYFEIPVLPSAYGSVEVYLRCNPDAGGSIGNGYGIRWQATVNQCQIGRHDVVAGVTTSTILSTVVGGAPLVDGDAIGMRCIGPRLEFWARMAGVWEIISWVLDYTFTGEAPNSYIGIAHAELGANSARLDNFGGGDVVAAVRTLDLVPTVEEFR